MKRITVMVLVCILAGCQKETETCVVMSHSTSSDKYGYITYYTIMACPSGMHNVPGMDSYVLPVGDSVKREYLEYKY